MISPVVSTIIGTLTPAITQERLSEVGSPVRSVGSPSIAVSRSDAAIRQVRLTAP